MINGVSSSSHVAESYQVQHPSNPQTQKNSQNEQQPQDTVVLSKKATEGSQARESNHHGKSH